MSVLISRKNEKKSHNLLSTEYTQRMVKVKNENIYYIYSYLLVPYLLKVSFSCLPDPYYKRVYQREQIYF